MKLFCYLHGHFYDSLATLSGLPGSGLHSITGMIDVADSLLSNRWLHFHLRSESFNALCLLSPFFTCPAPHCSIRSFVFARLFQDCLKWGLTDNSWFLLPLSGMTEWLLQLTNGSQTSSLTGTQQKCDSRSLDCRCLCRNHRTCCMGRSQCLPFDGSLAMTDTWHCSFHLLFWSQSELFVF